MKFSIIRITKEEFSSFNYTELFKEADYSRCFALFKANCCLYKLSWRSDLIEPEIFEIKSCIYGIGIDQSCVIINCITGKVVLNKVLFSNFSKFYLIKNYFLIICEFEILIFNMENYQMTNEISLPDVFVELIEHSDFFSVECMNKQKVLFEYKYLDCSDAE